MKARTLRRTAGAFMVVAGALLMWLSTEALGGALLMASGIALEILGIALERRGDAMPWNAAYYPASMKNLPTPVRLKAIEIANALLEAGHPEGQAIRIGIAGAKRWAAASQDPEARAGSS